MNRDPYPYKILIVEDNPGDVLLIEEYLYDTMRQPSLSWANTFSQALAVLRDPGNEFEVVLLDLTLPDKKGLELLREIQVYTIDVPIIVLTGYTDARFAIRSLDEGMSDYLLKDQLNGTILYKSIIYSIQRHKYNADLKRSQKQYQDLFHISPQPMWVYDMETLNFLDVNQAAIDKYGYQKEEFLQMTIRDIRPRGEVPAMEKLLRDTRHEHARSHKEPLIHQIKTGEAIKVEVYSNYFLWRGRDARLVLAHDITERLNYIAAVESKNDALREIAWDQAHLVRAPIARMIGLVGLMKEMSRTSPEFEAFFNYLDRSTTELDKIIKNIIDKTIVDTPVDTHSE